MKPTRTWILVADAAHARIFENLGPNKGLTEVTSESVDRPIPPTRDIGSDKPGRSFDSAGFGRHMMGPRADWHEQAKHEFAADLAHWLNAAQLAKAYDRLVLIAAPKILGDLRAKLTPQAASLIHAELDKDLTKHKPEDIEKHLGQVLAV